MSDPREIRKTLTRIANIVYKRFDDRFLRLFFVSLG